jgi:uncharacterized protein with beta-barrel porin domain
VLALAATLVFGDVARADGGAGSQGSPTGGVGGLDQPTGPGGNGGDAANNSGGGGGGAGTTGGTGGAGDLNGGNGGQGGAHGYVGAGLPLSVSTGTNGVAGFDGAGGAGGGGGGGAGGYGAVLTGSGSLGTLNFNVTGGAGGNGGIGGTGAFAFRGGGAGTGGIGLDFTSGAPTTVTIGSGVTVQGGDGGIGGIGGAFGSGGGGAGGAGIAGSSLTIVNAGTIRNGTGGAGGISGGGGAAGAAGADGNAITFTGGTNSLEFRAGSSIFGNVVAFSALDSFKLGGSTNSSFDVSAIGVQYQNFGVFQKTGNSAWTLTGTPGSATPWTISQGTLAGGATNVFGTTSAITVNAVGTMDLAGFGQTIGSLSGSTGAVVTNSSATPATLTTNGAGNASTTYAGTITDTAATGGAASAGALSLVKNGTGTLTLSGAPGSLIYHGDTTVNAGTLHISNSSFTNQQGSNLTVNNTGTYRIDHLLTNSGAIQVNAGGFLDASAGSITNHATGTIINNGRIDDALDNAGTVTNNLTYNADIAGNTGTITNSATGIWTGNVVTNASNATGIANSGIWIGDVQANTGTVVNDLTWTGAITTSGVFHNNTPGTVSGLVTNSGTATNSGTLNGGLSNTAGTFGNSGTVNNGATVAGGTLNTNTATSVVNGGLTNSATVNAQNQLNGAILNQGAGIFTVTGTLAGNGTFTNNGTAQFNVTGGDFTGVTTLTNNSTNATGISVSAARTLSANSLVNAAGATIHNLGTITTSSTINDGTITGAYAMTGGTLSGTGSVQNLAVNGGTFAPGNGTPGSSMTVTTSLSFQSAAVFMVQINPTAASFANVTGTAALGGATVNATFAAGSYISKTYTIVQATGTVSGKFNPTVVNTNLPSNFRTTLSYDIHDAYLNLALNFTAPTGLNGNQQNVANALTNFFNTTGSIPIAFGALTPAGLSQASGEGATGSQQATFDAMTQFMGAMTDPFIGGRGDGMSAGSSATPFAEEIDAANAYAARDPARSRSERDAYAAIYRSAPAMAAPFTPGWSVWAAGYGGSQNTNGTTGPGSSATTSRVAATAVGVDYRFSPDTIAGFAMAGGGASFNVNGFGTGRSDLFQAGAFARHTIGPAYFTAALAYGWQDITTDRTVTIAGMDRLHAHFNANAYSGRLEDGYRFVTPWMGVAPYAAAQFTTFDLPAYAESVLSGASTFALAYGAKSITDVRSEIGVRSDTSWAMADSMLTLRGRFAWARDYHTDRSIGATFQTLPGASFVVSGAAQSPDKALTTASAEVKWRSGISLAATFEGEFSGNSGSYAGKGVARYQW